MGREGDSLLERVGVPDGYIATWMSFLRRYRQEAQAPSTDTLETVPDQDTSVELPDEDFRIFRLFVHWLYTGEIVTICANLSQQCIYASLYGLAERLDVPDLRHECYSKLRELYQSGNSLPDGELLAVAIEKCSSECVLRSFLVQLFAHAVITKSTTDTARKHLDIYPVFYDEVAREIMRRLLAHEESQHPHQIETLNSDDSDSDYEVDAESADHDSDSESDSYISETTVDEEEDSSADEPEQEGPLSNCQNNQKTESEESDVVNSDAPATSIGGVIKSAADGTQCSIAGENNRDLVSIKEEQSDESETSKNEDTPSASDSERSVKNEGVESALSNVPKIHDIALGTKKASEQKPQDVEAMPGSNNGVEKSSNGNT